EAGGEDWELPALERRLAELLDAAAQEPNGAADATLLGRLALEARGRADALASEQLGDTPLLKRVPPEAAGRLRPAAELLLEAYLDLGEGLHSESGRERAQAYAAQLLDCVSIGRRPLGRAGAGARGVLPCPRRRRAGRRSRAAGRSPEGRPAGGMIARLPPRRRVAPRGRDGRRKPPRGRPRRYRRAGRRHCRSSGDRFRRGRG